MQHTKYKTATNTLQLTSSHFRNLSPLTTNCGM